MFTDTEISKAIQNLIAIASKYPDDKLITAIDNLRLIVRKQQIYINEMREATEK